MEQHSEWFSLLDKPESLFHRLREAAAEIELRFPGVMVVIDGFGVGVEDEDEWSELDVFFVPEEQLIDVFQYGKELIGRLQDDYGIHATAMPHTSEETEEYYPEVFRKRVVEVGVQWEQVLETFMIADNPDDTALVQAADSGFRKAA